jgi:hypothetical protein
MSRIKLLLDLIEDVRAVANDLQTIADAMVSDEPSAADEPTEKPMQETPAEKAEPERTIRLEDVRAVLASKSRDGYGAQVRELIAEHGGSKLSDIDPSEYGAMLKEAEVFGNAT